MADELISISLSNESLITKTTSKEDLQNTSSSISFSFQSKLWAKKIMCSCWDGPKLCLGGFGGPCGKECGRRIK